MNIDNLKPHTIFFDKARFSHPELNNVMKGVEELLKCGGSIPVTNCLLGPSRVGKSVVVALKHNRLLVRVDRCKCHGAE